MKYLFFLISFLYSTIFFLIYKFINNDPSVTTLSLKDSIILGNSQEIIVQSFFGNLLIEASIFFIVGLFLFFYFSSFQISKSLDEGEDKSIESSGKLVFFKKINYSNIVYFSKKFSYYIGFLFFYVSLYLMSFSFEEVSFSIFIFILNIIIYVYFFASKQTKLSSDLLKVNSILLSTTYIFFYIYIIILNDNFFGYIDIINSFLIIFSFLFYLYFDKKRQNKKNYDETILLHLIIYVFFVGLFYSYHYILQQNILYWICVLTSIFGFLLFEFFPKKNFLKFNKIILRYIGIIFLYFSSLIGIIYFLSKGFSFVILVAFLFQIFYNFFIHQKYNNLISFFLGVFLSNFLIYYLIINFNVLDFRYVYFLIFSLFLSFFMIIITYFVKLKSNIDSYIINFFSYFVNISSVIIFLLYNYKNFEIFYIGLLFFVESIYFFLSYTKISNKKYLVKK